MPATLYRLVGKPHHLQGAEQVDHDVAADSDKTDIVIEQVSPAAQVTVESSAPNVELSVETTVVQPVVPELAPVAEVPAAETAVSAPTISWDASMSRNQLAKIATSLGLSFSDKSTKAELLALLDSSKNI